MKRRTFANRRGIAWLLSVAFLLMAVASGASWQCLDGHPCPPECVMLHQEDSAQAHSASPPACCIPKEKIASGAPHCALCSKASPANTRIQEGCTSPGCVLRIQARPDILSQSHFYFGFDTATLLLPNTLCVPAPKMTGAVSFRSPRAPPNPGIVRITSPRAPPV